MWHRSPRMVFSVSIGQTGNLSYAGVFGQNTTHGTETFVDDVPKTIEAGLARLFPSGS